MLRAGDIVTVLAPGTALPRVSRLFLGQAAPPSWDQVTHDFLLDGRPRWQTWRRSTARAR